MGAAERKVPFIPMVGRRALLHPGCGWGVVTGEGTPACMREIEAPVYGGRLARGKIMGSRAGRRPRFGLGRVATRNHGG